MSSHVIGFKPPDAKWRQMKSVWDACMTAHVNLPAEVSGFFRNYPPSETGVEVPLEDHACCKEYSEEMVSGFEIDLTKLPKDVTVIRFYNSY